MKDDIRNLKTRMLAVKVINFSLFKKLKHILKEDNNEGTRERDPEQNS